MSQQENEPKKRVARVFYDTREKRNYVLCEGKKLFLQPSKLNLKQIQSQLIKKKVTVPNAKRKRLTVSKRKVKKAKPTLTRIRNNVEQYQKNQEKLQDLLRLTRAEKDLSRTQALSLQRRIETAERKNDQLSDKIISDRLRLTNNSDRSKIEIIEAVIPDLKSTEIDQIKRLVLEGKLTLEKAAKIIEDQLEKNKKQLRTERAEKRQAKKRAQLAEEEKSEIVKETKKEKRELEKEREKEQRLTRAKDRFRNRKVSELKDLLEGEGIKYSSKDRKELLIDKLVKGRKSQGKDVITGETKKELKLQAAEKISKLENKEDRSIDEDTDVLEEKIEDLDERADLISDPDETPTETEDDSEDVQGGALENGVIFNSKLALARLNAVRGSGRNQKVKKEDSYIEGLYNYEINKYLKEFPQFSGTFTRDEISHKYMAPRIPSGFIVNTVTRKEANDGVIGHWVAVYINQDSCEVFDPLAQNIPIDMIASLNKLINHWRIPTMLKFKVNNVKFQDGERGTDGEKTCGHHCINFLNKRFKGVPFKTVTKFDKSDKNEKSLKKVFGYI